MKINSFTKSYHLLSLILLVVFGLASNSFANENVEYTLGGTYRFHGQNTFGTNPTLDMGISVNGSMLYNETHEIGLNFDYSINWEEVSKNKRISQISTWSPQIFYRNHFLLSNQDARFPIVGYVGPHIGGVKMVSPNGTSSFDFLVGAAVGFNLFLAEDVALDVLLLKYSVAFQENPRGIFDQGLGVKFFY